MYVCRQSPEETWEAVRIATDPRGRKHTFERSPRARLERGRDLEGHEGTTPSNEDCN